MKLTARCPHCGLEDAPTRGPLDSDATTPRYLERHYPADSDPQRDPGHVICYGSSLQVGEPCGHIGPSGHCIGQAPTLAAAVRLTPRLHRVLGETHADLVVRLPGNESRCYDANGLYRSVNAEIGELLAAALVWTGGATRWLPAPTPPFPPKARLWRPTLAGRLAYTEHQAAVHE